MLRRSSRWWLVACLAASACGGEGPIDEPAPVRWDRDVCERCAMAIGDRRFAAQIRYGSEVHLFDDFGCALLWREEHTAGAPTAFWVRDATDGTGWLDARTAHYRAGYPTPMGYGFGAVAEPGAQDASFDEVRQRIRAIESRRRADGRD